MECDDNGPPPCAPQVHPTPTMELLTGLMMLFSSAPSTSPGTVRRLRRKDVDWHVMVPENHTGQHTPPSAAGRSRPATQDAQLGGPSAGAGARAPSFRSSAAAGNTRLPCRRPPESPASRLKLRAFAAPTTYTGLLLPADPAS